MFIVLYLIFQKNRQTNRNPEKCKQILLFFHEFAKLCFVIKMHLLGDHRFNYMHVKVWYITPKILVLTQRQISIVGFLSTHNKPL